MADRQDRYHDRDDAERVDRERDQGDYQGNRNPWRPERRSPGGEFEWAGGDAPGSGASGRPGQGRNPASLEADNERSGWSNSSDWDDPEDWGESEGDQADDWAEGDLWEAEAELETGAPARDPGYTQFWLVPGPYAGVGPRGYQRPRERIQEDVCDRLCQHGQLDAADIEALVDENGEVTLTGTVPDRWTKRLAEDVAASVRGVRDVFNQIRVRRPGEAPGEAAAAGNRPAGGSQEAPHE